MYAKEEARQLCKAASEGIMKTGEYTCVLLLLRSLDVDSTSVSQTRWNVIPRGKTPESVHDHTLKFAFEQLPQKVAGQTTWQ